jgi:hypothetical protein
MTESQLQKLLGTSDPDPGCEDSGDLMDAYCELVLRGEPLSDRFNGFLTHMANCIACREDTEGLLALLREQEKKGAGVRFQPTATLTGTTHTYGVSDVPGYNAGQLRQHPLSTD